LGIILKNIFICKNKISIKYPITNNENNNKSILKQKLFDMMTLQYNESHIKTEFFRF